MKTLTTWKTALAVALMLGTASTGFAQYLVPLPRTVVTYSAPPLLAPSPVYYPAPAPIVNYSYYPATTVYSAPVGTTVYSAPVAAPTVVYSAPAVAPVGVYTTRTYTGLGIFRPRGVYTQSYYTPFLP